MINTRTVRRIDYSASIIQIFSLFSTSDYFNRATAPNILHIVIYYSICIPNILNYSCRVQCKKWYEYMCWNFSRKDVGQLYSQLPHWFIYVASHSMVFLHRAIFNHGRSQSSMNAPCGVQRKVDSPRKHHS